MFQASPAPEYDRSSTRGEERAEATTPASDHGSLHRKPSSTLSVTMERLRPPAPSHISWKSPSTPNSPTSSPDPAWGAQYGAHYASTPSLLLLTPGSATAHKSSLRRQSSQSLRSQSLAASENSDRGSMVDVPPVKQLSLTEEQVHFPVVRRPSMDSVPPTPESIRGNDGHVFSSPYPAFLTRPLNRSISQASTSTFRSTTSVVPPKIPPLDLRPDFQNTLGLPARKTRLVVSSLSPVAGSPTRPNKYSVIYEDGSSVRTASFITAPSENTPDPEGEQEHKDYAASYVGETEETLGAPAGMLPEGLYDVPSKPEQREGGKETHTLAGEPSISTAESRLSRSASPSESYIHKRWLKGVYFGNDRFITSNIKQQHMTVTSAYVLFWLGFVGPWCWLIGGWMLSKSGEIKLDGKDTDAALPMWTRRSKKYVGPAEREKSGGRKLGLKLWYPLVAPPVEGLSPSVGSRTSITSVRRWQKGSASRMDRWVVRCRIAAIMSGVLLLAACIVAAVVAGGVRS
ncbi:hypothetical protein AcW1_002849 [Taiwanofungus camphoratus]|nr:hypothetical protein AcW1_002849 [Antrodia cinnamomea]